MRLNDRGPANGVPGPRIKQIKSKTHKQEVLNMKSLRKKILAMASVVAVSGLMMASVAGAADKLIVKDATGTNTVFKVQDDGSFSAGTAFSYDATNKKFGSGLTAGHLPESTFHLVDLQNVSSRGLIVAQHNNAANAANLIFRKSWGDDLNPAPVTTGTYVGTFHGNAYDGAAYQTSASIAFFVDGPVQSSNPGPGKVPMAIIFYTGEATAAGAGVNQKVERARLNSVGNFGIGTTAPTSKLQVVGLPVYANNALAVAGGLTAGAFYRTGGDPDLVAVVH